MRNHSYENDFDLHENETARRTHFHMKGFAFKMMGTNTPFEIKVIWKWAGLDSLKAKET